ncbi:hypothetical protein [Caballeronia arationis]|uniref:hypothetical protein n=1 Tax=Caballeronia arationis TaxID=1777142 RepID=UPI0011982225|nr:hypothetical protein [Caballeronia arationis]
MTGEHILVFGNADSVFIGLNSSLGEAPHPAEAAATRQDWKEILREDAGRWELEVHYHPGAASEHDQAPMWRRLPSTGEEGRGDFQVLRYESGAAGGSPRSSVIDFTHEDKPGHTVFGFDPADAKPYWIDVENPVTGAREQHRFATTEEYEGWARQHGAEPNVDVADAAQGRTGPGHDVDDDSVDTPRVRPTDDDKEPVRPGAGKKGASRAKAARDAALAAETDAEMEASFVEWGPAKVPPKEVPPMLSEAERIKVSAKAQAEARAVESQGVEDFRAESRKNDRAVEHFMNLDPDGFLAVVRAEVEGPEASVPSMRDLLVEERKMSPAEADASIRRRRRSGEEQALAAFERTLRDKMTPKRAAAEREALGRLLNERGLRESVSFARNRHAWGGELERLFNDGSKSSRALIDILLQSPHLLAAARMQPSLVKERFERMIEKAPRSKPTLKAFEAQWNNYMTHQILPILSENDATFRMARKNRGILKSESTYGHRENTLVNEGGIDIVSFGLADPPLPEKAEVYLTDDKAERKRRLRNVSAQTENLGQNLRQHADEFAATLKQHRAEGKKIDEMSEKAAKQLLDAANAIEDLDKSRVGRGGKGPRHRKDTYIDSVAKILKENHIHMEITSERGNIKTLAKWLERYGFKMAFADEDARNKEPPPSSKPTP